MIVEMTAVPEMECAAAEIKDRTLSVTPLFWNPKELASVASIIVKTSQGKIVCKGMIRVSGNSGKPTITIRTEPVTPLVDRSKR